MILKRHYVPNKIASSQIQFRLSKTWFNFAAVHWMKLLKGLYLSKITKGKEKGEFLLSETNNLTPKLKGFLPSFRQKKIKI